MQRSRITLAQPRLRVQQAIRRHALKRSCTIPCRFIQYGLGVKNEFKKMKVLKYHLIESPLGQLKLVANDENLVAVLWDKEKANRVKLEAIEAMPTHPILSRTQIQLKEFFSHQRNTFDIPIEANGTAFQRSVWNALLEIPYGMTWTYKQVATKIGRPRSVRAVGAAIGRNPLSILIPCHRVIGVNGKLTGFAGGIDKKQILLDLEKPICFR